MSLITFKEKLEFDEQISEYLDVKKLKKILNSIVATCSKDIYKDVNTLSEKMRENGALDIEIYRTNLVVTLPFFRHIIFNDIEHISNIDFANFVSAVSENTGLLRPVAIGILEAIFSSLNMIREVKNLKKMNIDSFKSILLSNKNSAYVLPYSEYSDDLNKMNNVIEGNSKEDVSTYIEMVRCYAQLGVPRAKYLLARTMDIDDESSTGFNLLKEASVEGDALATAYLGDYYYKKGSVYWKRALSYYTGYSRATLNELQISRLINILNAKEFNKRILFLNILFTILTIASLIIIPPFSVFKGQVWIGVVAVILEIIYNIRNYIYYKDDNYYILSHISPNFIIWMLYMIIKITF